MKKNRMGLVILVSMTVLACVGCGGGSGTRESGSDSQSTVKAEESAAVSDTDPAAAESPVTITIDGEEYALPMSFADFTARGWEYYDPSAGDGWDHEIQAGSYDWMYFSKGDIKALMVYVSGAADSALMFSKGQVIGFEVAYDRTIDTMDAREVVNIPTGSIKINGLGIGEATQKEMANEMGEARFSDPAGGAYQNGNETYFTDDNAYTLFVGYDENSVISSFQYIIGH